MGEFKKSTTLTGKYKCLQFVDGELHAIDKKEGEEIAIDLLEDLFAIYKDSEFSLSTKSNKDEEVIPDIE